ncbi:hypothetical protein [Spirosoma sordidisoli]|uniref:Uncharacterized protein n=1 Tax=Spirosoma sordidisoli TaxID=2502893 RepID=A0A4Q2UJI7_9BACT|nr:hypothetical protein [Spirosoma sordidisoli]RYC69653.1 hypothetical protein EQG79_13715 [Spirosoma sordidisoli]
MPIITNINPEHRTICQIASFGSNDILIGRSGSKSQGFYDSINLMQATEEEMKQVNEAGLLDVTTPQLNDMMDQRDMIHIRFETKESLAKVIRQLTEIHDDMPDGYVSKYRTFTMTLEQPSGSSDKE